VRRFPLAIALLLNLTAAALAQPPTTALVIVEGLTWQQVERGEIGGLYVLSQYGAAGLMSIGASGNETTSRFALTLQTGRRLVLPSEGTVEAVRRRYPKVRWLTDELARAGVTVTLHLETSQQQVRALLAPSFPPPSPAAQLQIWWIAGEPATISRALERAISPLNPERDRVLIIGLPPAGERLAPVIAAGGELRTGVLTSQTTRTEGLVSDVDIAPTLLRWHGLALHVGEHPMRVVAQEPMVTVKHLARLSRWNGQGLIPVGALQVGGGLLAVLAALRLIRQRRVPQRAGLVLSVAIATLLSLPAGTVIAPYLPASRFAQYAAHVLLSAWGLSLLAHWGVWHEPFRVYVRACALSILVVVVDAVSGQRGVRSSVYSAYALSGIRFYGIGNEMMGVLVGCALAWGLFGLKATWRAVVWFISALVLATPVWGANLGGLLTAATGLGCAWEWSHKRRMPRPQRCAQWLLMGMLAAFGIMWVDSLSASPSHIGETWLRWQAEGFTAIVDTLLSKLALMSRVLLSPFAWGVLLVIGLALWAMGRSGTLTAWRNGWRGEYLPWLVCMGAAFVFNDSGFVPAAAILGVGVGALLTRRLQEVQHGSSA
jgi:hypothetical protein